jgi:ribosomal protein S18 acetylase RimI-like enzyme
MDIPLIRPAVPADFGQILALWESEERYVGLADRLEHLETLHAFSAELFLVAEANDEIVGTLIAGWDGWRAQMARLATRRDWRRRGIAHRLVEEGERRLKERGAGRVYALVDRRSEHAVPFWDAMGYAANEDILQYSRNLRKGPA